MNGIKQFGCLRFLISNFGVTINLIVWNSFDSIKITLNSISQQNITKILYNLIASRNERNGEKCMQKLISLLIIETITIVTIHQVIVDRNFDCCHLCCCYRFSTPFSTPQKKAF